MAYVAKDPVNRRGKRRPSPAVSRSHAARPDAGHQVFLITSTPFADATVRPAGLLVTAEVCGQPGAAAKWPGWEALDDRELKHSRSRVAHPDRTSQIPRRPRTRRPP